MTSGQLKKLRQKMGWTQKDVAKKLGVTESAVCHWENDRRPMPEMADRFLKVIASQENQRGAA